MEECNKFAHKGVDNSPFTPALDSEKETYRMLNFLTTGYTAAKSRLFDTPIVENLKKMPGQDEALLFELQGYFEDEEKGD